jgi:hypothetical protein
MPRPDSVTNEDISRWSEMIDNDPYLDAKFANNPVIREVCYAGRYLCDKLMELKCPEDKIGAIMYCAGAASFGRPDPWEVHQLFLDQFIDGTLEFDETPNDEIN